MKTYAVHGTGNRMEIVFNKPELAIRMVEALTNSERPAGASAAQLLRDLEKRAPDVYETAVTMVDVASAYFLEICGAGPPTQ